MKVRKVQPFIHVRSAFESELQILLFRILSFVDEQSSHVSVEILQETKKNTGSQNFGIVSMETKFTYIFVDIVFVRPRASFEQFDYEREHQLGRVVLGAHEEERLFQLLNVELNEVEGLPKEGAKVGDRRHFGPRLQVLARDRFVILATPAGRVEDINGVSPQNVFLL